LQTHFAKILRRLLFGVILAVIVTVLLNYLQIGRSRTTTEEELPEILSSEMVRSAEGLEYFDYAGDVLRFKIRARKLLESREGMSYLEGIEAHDFAPDGSTGNQIHSRNALYDQNNHTIDFSGDVQLLLGNEIELQMESLHYDLNRNIGKTDDSLEFFARDARGTAKGVRFDQKRGILDLSSDVDFYVTQPAPHTDTGGAYGEVHTTSEKAHFSEIENRIIFSGRARIESNSGILSGTSIEMFLDPDRKTISFITASGPANYRFEDSGESRTLGGDSIHFSVDPSGVLKSIEVSGKARFTSLSSLRELDLSSREIRLQFDPAEGSLTDLEGTTDVVFGIKDGLRRTDISGNLLHAVFQPVSKNVQSLFVHENARFSILDAVDSTRNDLEADEIRLEFLDKEGRTVSESIRAEGSVSWRSEPRKIDSGSPNNPLTLEASLLDMLYADGGEYLESVRASGNVVIFEHGEGVPSRPQLLRLNASSASFRFLPQSKYPREMDAAGAVQIYHRAASERSEIRGTEEFRTTSDRLKAFFEIIDDGLAIESFVQSGSFVYQDESRTAKAGECNYSAGDGMMVLTESPEISDEMGVTTGERVEYDQARKILSVGGSVRSVLRLQQAEGTFFGSPSSSSAPVVIVAERMRYRTDISHLSYLTNVQMLTESQQLQTQTLEIFGDGERVEAMGGVLHLISQEGRSGKKPQTLGPEKSGSSQEEPIKIRSSNLRYLSDSKALFYSGEVHLNSRNLVLFSSSLDAVLDEGGKNVDHAIAKEDVFMRRGSTECKGEVAYWYLDPGKLIVLGNPAEAYDPDRGRSLARRLTYFTTDDRILLESE